MSRLTLGILTLYIKQFGILEERKVFEQMTIEGEKLNMQIIIFTPSDVITSQRKVLAHIYNTESKNWQRKLTPIPNLIFDRCRLQRGIRMKELRQFKADFPRLHFLNKPLGNKWTMHQKLSLSPFISDYLPETIKYTKISELISMLKKHRIIYIKPVNGTGGRGILRIEHTARRTLSVEGRDHNRKIISPRQLSANDIKYFLTRWDGTGTSYLVQQGIDLTLKNGRVHDYRILVQKDGTGQWDVTGGAGRVGAARSITANLHGGGSAVDMSALMKSFIDPNVNLNAIQAEINQLVIEIALHLENEGYQLCELAIDLAIDQSGKIWIIELNPKPAREVFKQIGANDQYKDAVRRPLEYALFHHLIHTKKNE